MPDAPIVGTPHRVPLSNRDAARTDKATQFGFTFGPMDVVRLGSFDNGRVVLRVETGYGCIDIYASPTGRSLRAFRDGEEMKVPSGKAGAA